MKKIGIYIGSLALAAALFAGCNDWTETEGIPFDKGHDENYFAELRKYKATKHPITFGWFSEWTGKGVTLNNSLIGIPDSMDMVSIWGNWSNLSADQKKDMEEMRKRGTKMLMCFIVGEIGSGTTPASVSDDWIVDGVQYDSRSEAMGAFWGWFQDGTSASGAQYGDATPEGMERAIRKYARSILDTIAKYDYDGFDFDYEPNYGYGGNISSHQDRCHIFLSALAEKLGPKSGSGKMLVVDGEPQTLNAESGPLLDYYIIQAYDCTSYTNLDMRLNGLIAKFESVESKETILSKLIWCENFEKWQNSGGPTYTDRDGTQTYSLMGMARYTRPDIDARIGGVGAYRFNLHRAINDYIVMREVIQQLNPAHPAEQPAGDE